MFLRRFALIGIGLSAVCSPRLAVGQDRPVVFIHGLKSTDAVWADTASRLQAQLSLQAYRPNPSWSDVFQTQAAQVDNAVGALPASAVAVGHSNGGLVAREWSRTHPLDALVTLGTPNSGAPIAYNMLHWINFNFAAGDAIADLYAAAGQCARHGCNWSSLMYYRDVDQLLAWLRGLLDSSLLGIASTIGVGTTAPVLAQMVPESTFLRQVNSSDNLSREIAQVPGRVGLVSSAHNFYNAGSFRLVWPDDADAIDFWKDLTVDILNYLVLFIHRNAELDDHDGFNLADAMSVTSAWIDSLDGRWCEVVTWMPGSGFCDYNDEVVPMWSQILPQAPFLWNQDGPIHTREVQQSDYYLYQALTAFAHVPQRPPSGGGGGGGGGGTGGGGSILTANAAVRGCSGYSEWAPVYQSTAGACASYCESNGANACEWYEDGSCFVEFGSGCGVQSGYAGWSAGVFSDGGAGGGGSGGGGGTGGAQMEPDSAVRGCAGYVEYPPVYQADANACLSYCVQNGGDACEWYADGSCFLEQGSGCHTESGYGNWSAAVIH